MIMLKNPQCKCVKCGAPVICGAGKTTLLYNALTHRKPDLTTCTTHEPVFYFCESCTKKLTTFIRRG